MTKLKPYCGGKDRKGPWWERGRRQAFHQHSRLSQAGTLPAWLADEAKGAVHHGKRGPHLIVHDGSETKDADVDIILLAHQAGVLQGPAARESTVPGGQGQVIS